MLWSRHFLLLSGVSLIVFVQSAAPLLFLLIPVSVLIAFRLGPAVCGNGHPVAHRRCR